MAHEHMKTGVIGGTSQIVRRSRVIYQSGEWQVNESVSFGNISFGAQMGIAQEWCRQAPGTPADTSLYAGVTGDEILYYGVGSEALAECGGTVTAGNQLMSDNTARVVNSTGNIAASWAISFPVWEIGVALESGTTGDVVRMRVQPQIRQPSNA